MSNPHYEAATSERFAGDWRFTEAVLAVAYEQRTANMIAFADFMLSHTGSAEICDFDEDDIAARLGKDI